MAKSEKVKDEGSIAARAWNATKADADPDWDAIPNHEFKGKLEHAAERVKATGIAQNNFEIKVKELGEADAEANKDEGPMAVVDPNPAISAAAPTAIAAEETAKAPAKKAAAKGTKAKPAAKGGKAKSASKAAAKKSDKSGHVPTAKEKAAAAQAEKDAPLHP